MATPKKMDRLQVDWWDELIRKDLANRATMNNELLLHERMVRNTGEGQRRGNLVKDWLGVLQSRLFAGTFNLDVTADDPSFKNNAEETEVLCQAIIRIVDLGSKVYDAVTDASWAGCGWLQVGHPLCPYQMDITRIPTEDTPAHPSDWEEVDPSMAKAFNLSPDNVPAFDIFNEPAQFPTEEGPSPVFDTASGVPYIERVDPRLIIHNREAATLDEMDYVARIHFMSIKEVKAVMGVDIDPSAYNISMVGDLFRAGGREPALYPTMLAIVEVWIKRDRENPEFNNWRLVYVLGRTDLVLKNHKNPMNGLIPLQHVRLSKVRKLQDTSICKEMADFTDMFDLGWQSIMRKLKRMLNEKYAVSNMNGMTADSKARLLDDNYRGFVEMRDPDAVKALTEQSWDAQFVMYLNYIQTQSKSPTGQSSLDGGQAIKDISARQTQALMDSTNISVESVKGVIEIDCIHLLMKLMRITGLYNYLGGGRSYSLGDKLVTVSSGTHDWTTSLLYGFELQDTKQHDSEKQLVWNQFLRTVTTGPLLPYLDLEELTKTTLKRFGEAPTLLASRGANRPPQGIAGQTPILDNQGQPVLGAGNDLMMGQHPERASEGLSLANSLSGSKVIGD